ncbi:MAG: glycosyltransferase [Desulfobacterota bacterium]|nr:glycosyltransferase [Thermodesulfobacteriota bacterium]
MTSPLVSVIIPTHNRAHCIRRAVASVMQQTYRHYELIVVDDCSTDATQETLQEYAGSCRVLKMPVRSGPAAARNKGIAAAQGALIAFLDSDDAWLPEKLAAQVQFFMSHPDCAVCQTDEIWIRNGVRVNPMKKHSKHSGWIFEQCLPLCIVSPSAVMLHRRVFDTVGVFDESMPACEDYDLWLRISVRYAMYLIRKPLVIKYGGHSDQQSRTVPHLDRWRIYALCKLLASGLLTPDQYRAAHRELERKCHVYGTGCMKHGRQEEGLRYLKLPTQYKQRGDKTAGYEPYVIP